MLSALANVAYVQDRGWAEILIANMWGWMLLATCRWGETLLWTVLLIDYSYWTDQIQSVIISVSIMITMTNIIVIPFLKRCSLLILLVIEHDILQRRVLTL